MLSKHGNQDNLESFQMIPMISSLAQLDLFKQKLFPIIPFDFNFSNFHIMFAIEAGPIVIH